MGIELFEPTKARIDLLVGKPFVDADIAVGANINADKIGTGVVDNTEFNRLNGITSAIEEQGNKGAVSGYAGLGASQELLLVNFPAGTALQVLRRNAGNTALEFATPAAGSDTPWTEDHAADGFDLNDLSNLEFRDPSAGVPAATVNAIYVQASGMIFNTVTGNLFEWSVNDVNEMTLSATQLDLLSNNVVNAVLITPTIASFINATHSHLNAAGGGTITVPAISGTSAEFDTANTDDDFAYIGQANVFTQDQEIEKTGAIPILTFDRPEVLVDNTTITRIDFRGFDDANATEIYAQIRVVEASDAAANPDGCLDLRVDEAGTLKNYITLNDLGGADIDLRRPVNFNSQNASNMGTLNTHTVPSGTSTFALVSDNLSVFAATTSLQFIGVISDETGTGLLMFNNTPTILTPTVASFVNATHDHQAAAGGGTLLSTAALSDTADLAYLNQANTFGAFLNSFAGSTMRIPVSATPTIAVNGDIAIDTTITDFTTPLVRYFGTESMVVVAVPDAQIVTPTGGHVITYNATNDEFELVAQTGGSQTPWTSNIDAAGFALLNFGFIESNATNPADSGVVRLGNTDPIRWRNFANTGNLEITVNVADDFHFVGFGFIDAGIANIINVGYIQSAASPAGVAGFLRLSNVGSGIYWRNAGNTADLVIDVTADGIKFELPDPTTEYQFESTFSDWFTNEFRNGVFPGGVNASEFQDDGLVIQNPANTFNYTILAAAIAAARTITLPLLTANDIMVTEAFAQTLTNKTIDGDLNTIIDINETQQNVSVGVSGTVLTSNGVGIAPTYQTAPGSQTPWTSDIDADGFDLTDLSNIIFRTSTGVPAATDRAIHYNDTEGMIFNALTGDFYQLEINAVQEYRFTATQADFNSNNVVNMGTLNTHVVPGGTSTFALFSDNLSVFAATTSAQLAGVISDETGSGLLVFGTSPTIVTPTIASFVNATHAHTAASSGGTLVSTTALSDTADIAYLNTANTFIAGNKNTFAHSATTAGIAVLPIAGNPSGQVDGDMWLNVTTQQLFARINGANIDLSASGGEVFTWTADHSAAGFDLTNLDNVLFTQLATAPAGTVQYISGTAGGLDINTPTGDTISLKINNIATVQISSTALDIATNILQFVDADTTITAVTNDLEYDVSTGNIHRWRINNVSEMQLDTTQLNLVNKNLNLGSGILVFNNPNTSIASVTNDLEYDVALGEQHRWRVNNISEMFLTNVALDIQNNNLLIGTGILQFVDANQTITNSGGNLIYDVAAGQVQLWRVNNVTEMQISATALDLQNNTLIVGTGPIRFIDVNTTITAVTNDLQYDVATGNTHRFRVNNATEMELSATELTLAAGNNLVLQASGAMGFIDIGEITVPANPAANFGRLYTKDVGGTHSELFYRDELGTETNVLTGTETTTWTADHNAAGFDLLNVGGIQINNPADTFQYIITPAAIVADRIVNLPLLIATSTIAFADFANAWGDGIKQTFNPSAVTPGINFGSNAGDPSTPADGDVWYNSTTNKFRARENAANVDMIGGGGAGNTFARAVKPADEIVNNSTTLQDDDDFTFTPTINKNYFIMVVFLIDSEPTPGIKIAWSIPTGAIIRSPPANALIFRTTTSYAFSTVASNAVVYTTNGADQGNGNVYKLIMGATAGSVTLQWAQNVAEVSDTRMREGAVMVVWEET